MFEQLHFLLQKIVARRLEFGQECGCLEVTILAILLHPEVLTSMEKMGESLVLSKMVLCIHGSRKVYFRAT